MKKILIALLAITLISCNKTPEPEPKLTRFGYEMHAKTTEVIEGINLDGLNWVSDYPWVASVSGNTIKANYVGVANFSNFETGFKFRVTVNPKYKLYSEESTLNYLKYIDWDETADEIKKSWSYSYKSGNFIVYESGEAKVPAVLFHFTDNRLDYFVCASPLKYALDVIDYMAERYEPLTILSDYEYAFMRCDEKSNPDLFLYVKLSTSNITVYFFPQATRAEAKNIDVDEIQKIITTLSR